MSLRVASPLKATTRERQLHVALYASHAQFVSHCLPSMHARKDA